VSFRIGQKIRNVDLRTYSDTGFVGSTHTITATTYTLVRGSVSFPIPSTGCILIELRADLWGSTSGENAYYAWGINGVDSVAPTDAECLRVHGANGYHTMIASVVTGLTPYATDQISLYARCDSAAGANVLNDRVVVRPA
jgi:hypothetical protein